MDSGLALAVSVGLFVSLLVRPTAEINLLNMATLVLASAAGIGLILRPSSPKWLIPASLCLLCSVIPTVFGAVFVLYAAPVHITSSRGRLEGFPYPSRSTTVEGRSLLPRVVSGKWRGLNLALLMKGSTL